MDAMHSWSAHRSARRTRGPEQKKATTSADPDRLSEQLRSATASFGIEEFREGQPGVMGAAVEGRGRAGGDAHRLRHKSAIYQVPGAALPGTAVVVPL